MALFPYQMQIWSWRNGSKLACWCSICRLKMQADFKRKMQSLAKADRKTRSAGERSLQSHTLGYWHCFINSWDLPCIVNFNSMLCWRGISCSKFNSLGLLPSISCTTVAAGAPDKGLATDTASCSKPARLSTFRISNAALSWSHE